jgi:hypothetical protein
MRLEVRGEEETSDLSPLTPHLLKKREIFMKLKSFIILLVIAGILGGTAYLATKLETVEKQEKVGRPLLSDFPMNEIIAVSIKSAENSASLKKGEKVWVLENRFDYPADFSAITDFVKNLKEAKVGRNFKAEQDTLARLALQDPDKKEVSNEEKGVRIILEGKEKKVLADLIVGKPREMSAPGAGGGQYVMLAKETTVYLVDKSFQSLDKKAAEWLDKDLTDVKATDVEKVVCLDPKSGKVVYTLKRPEKGKDAELAEIPAGRKIKKAKISSALGVLASLRIEDIADPAKKAEETGLDKALCLEYHLFDGTVYKAYPGIAMPEDAEKHYLKVEVGYTAPEVKAEDNAGDEKLSDQDKAKKEEERKKKEEDRKKQESELADNAKKLNDKISPWTYLIPKWKYENLVTNSEDFLEEVKKEEAKTDAPKAETPKGADVKVEPPAAVTESGENAEDVEAEDYGTGEVQEDESPPAEVKEEEAEVPQPETEVPKSEAETLKPEAETPKSE